MKISEQFSEVKSSLEKNSQFFLEYKMFSICQGFPRANLAELNGSCR